MISRSDYQRTFQSKSSTSRGHHATGVITNAFVPHDIELIRNSQPVSYECAQSLYSTADLEGLMKILAVPEDRIFESAHELIHAVTGWDLTRPPPNISGEAVFTRDSFKKMKKKQVKLILQSIPSHKGQSELSKLEMIERIMKDHDLSIEKITKKNVGKKQKRSNIDKASELLEKTGKTADHRLL